MKILEEFKEFAMRGNVLDMAIGVIIGGAFGKIVTALVDKIIMPPLGWLISGIDISSWTITIKKAYVRASGEAVPAVVLGVGEFLNTVIQFTIIAFAIFLLIKTLNQLKRTSSTPPAPAVVPEEVLLLRDIRDSLKTRSSD